LQDGLNLTNSIGLFFACCVYRFESKKKVIIKNLSDEPEREVEGTSPMGLLSLCASPGSLLEIKIEGDDESAKELSREIKIGLNEENYLWTNFKPRYEQIKHLIYKSKIEIR
jgi:phosphotransferase system HPr-like phosphotransfer protein